MSSMRVRVNIDVDDLERAVRFYTEAFGLRVARRRFDDSVVELAGASSPIDLLLKAAGTRATPSSAAVRDYARHWTPVHLDVEVDDVDVAVARAVAAGATLEGAVRDFAWGRLATLADPFGHGFCLVRYASTGETAAGGGHSGIIRG